MLAFRNTAANWKTLYGGYVDCSVGSVGLEGSRKQKQCRTAVEKSV